MRETAREASAGINRLIEDQMSEPGKFTFTITEFDDVISTPYRLANWEHRYLLRPRGMTALFDAIGWEIESTGADLSAMPEDKRPGTVIFVIVTDGYENSSHKYTGDQIKALVDRQRDVYGWQFQFLGAGESALQGKELNMPSTQYQNTRIGTQALYATASSTMTNLRSGLIDTYAVPEVVEP
jgi:hypothetical protein